MRVGPRFATALSVVVVLAVSGCGNDATSGSESAQNTQNTASADPTATEPTGDQDSDDQTDDGALEVEVEIEDGATTPAGKRVEVTPGQTIRLEVDSDMADELHLHADPEQTFDVKTAEDQVFEFSLDTPGVYELESHETGNQVISIQVQP